MRNNRIFLILLLFVSGIFFTPAIFGRATTYNSAGGAGDVKILKVRTVDNSSLEEIFGSSWDLTLQLAFGGPAHLVGARSKSEVLALDSDSSFGGIYPSCDYVVDYWIWTTEAFSSTPDYHLLTTYVLKHPENLTAYVNFLTYVSFGEIRSVTVPYTIGLLNQLPTPPETYLSELAWETNWTVSGNQIIHSGHPGYIVWQVNTTALYVTYPPGPPSYYYAIGSMHQNCTETWTYDSTYGAFIGYKIEYNGEIVYEFSIEIASSEQIPGIELPILLGVSIGIMTSLIYIIMKKKDNIKIN